MSTIFKITFANIGRKKFRTLLITLSIILSVALTYTVLSMSGTITEIMEQKIRKETGSTDLIITPGEKAASPYMETLDFSHVSGLTYQAPKLSAFGYTKLGKEKITVSLNGMNYSDYTKLYPAQILQKESTPTDTNSILIGFASSKEYHLSLGDDIEVTLAGKKMTFHISGILTDQNNNLGYELGSLSVLIDHQKLTNLLGLPNQVTSYYVKADPSYNLKEVQGNLERAFPSLKVRSLNEIGDYKQFVDTITSCLLLMVLAVIMVSTFIIYSSFKIIVIERMPLIGTLRSIGATKQKTITILLFEAIFYGVCGGIAGGLLGIFLLTMTIHLFFKSNGVSIENVSYINGSYLAISILIGLSLILISAIVPIIKTSNQTIRSIIFAEIHNEKHRSVIKTVVGFIMIGIAYVLFHTAPIELRAPLDGFGILLIAIGSALTIPMLSLVLTEILSFLFRPIFKDALGVTTANIKNDRTIMNNISLLAMGLGIILMINNFSTTVSVAVCDLYASAKSDMMSFYPMDDEFVQQVKQVEGVSHVYTTKEMSNVSANQNKVTIPTLVGIDGKNFSKYAWDEFGSYFTDQIDKELGESRSIIVSKFMAKKYKLKVGDLLDFDFNGITKNYKIITIVPSLLNNGTMCFVHEKFLIEDGGMQNDSSLYLNLKKDADMEQVKEKIVGLMPNAVFPLHSLEDMQAQNMKSNNTIFLLMKAISLIAMFIGVVGIFNNFTISFLSRKKIIATLRSLGLSKRKTIQSLIFEAFLCGCIGTLSGLAFGTLLLNAMTYMIEAIGIPSDVLFLNLNDFIFVIISGILLSILSAILPAISITKDNIVAGLRYE